MAKKVKKPKLRLPVKRIRIGCYYFIILNVHNSRRANQPLNPTNFELVRVLLRHIDQVRLNRLKYCCSSCYAPRYEFISYFDFYHATKQEVAEAKQRQKQLEYEKSDEKVDNF